MGTTLDDIAYELHLEDLHKSYIKSLEKFASSKNIKELKENLEELQGMRASIQDWMSNVRDEDLESLDQTLQEISTIDKVYNTLISESRKSKMYFAIGIVFAIIGILLSIGSIFL